MADTRQAAKKRALTCGMRAAEATKGLSREGVGSGALNNSMHSQGQGMFEICKNVFRTFPLVFDGICTV